MKMEKSLTTLLWIFKKLLKVFEVKCTLLGAGGTAKLYLWHFKKKYQCSCIK